MWEVRSEEGRKLEVYISLSFTLSLSHGPVVSLHVRVYGHGNRDEGETVTPSPQVHRSLRPYTLLAFDRVGRISCCVSKESAMMSVDVRCSPMPPPPMDHAMVGSAFSRLTSPVSIPLFRSSSINNVYHIHVTWYNLEVRAVKTAPTGIIEHITLIIWRHCSSQVVSTRNRFITLERLVFFPSTDTN